METANPITGSPYEGKHQDRYFGTLDDFYQDCADNDLPGYSFIEPRYNSAVVDGIFLPQNDQHPDSDLTAGEELVLNVYNAIRSRSEIWETSVLIITYDEHGGIYDHRIPPPAIPPDNCTSANPPFDFTRYGVRVPAVIVSPWTPRGTIINEVCDHTSLIACARKLLTGEWRDRKLGCRAEQAYPLDSAFDFSGGRRSRDDVVIRLERVEHHAQPAKLMNHLQQAHVAMAQSLEKRLSPRAETKIDVAVAKIKTDHEAQRYVSRVFARAGRLKSQQGRKCGCQ